LQCFFLLLLLHLSTTAFCLATYSVNGGTSTSTSKNKNNDDATGRFVIVSTKKNGGHAQFFPYSSSSKINHKGGNGIKSGTKTFLHIEHLGKKVQTALRSTFMPSGYPQRTPPGYLRYSVWSWIQDTSTQLRSVLAAQRILEGVGVGKEGATALSALMNFLARDGCGMIATLLFTSVASSRFRSDIKRWRMVADLAVDVGITLEVAAVAYATFFLPMICLGTAFKAICGVAAGACGGAINLHWAKGSDISDVNAKFGAQHTVTGGLGLVLAAIFARSVSTWKLWRLWVLYSALTVTHIVANMRCMRLIALESLNHVRMNIILVEFLAWWDQQQQQSSSEENRSTTNASPSILPPAQVSKVEPLFFLPSWILPRQHKLRKSSVPIYFGESFNDFCEHSKLASGAETAETLLNSPEEVVDLTFNGEGYLISAGSLQGKQKYCVDVVFRSNAQPEDEAKAYLHAILLGRELKKAATGGENMDEAQIFAAAEMKVNESFNAAWNIFQTSCEAAGWNLTNTEIQTLGYEIATAPAT